jgi:hypothetical protein
MECVSEWMSEWVCHNLVTYKLYTEDKETVENLAYNTTYRVLCEIWVDTEKPVVHQANNVAQPDGSI